MCALLASLRCCGWSPAVLLAVLLQLAPGHLTRGEQLPPLCPDSVCCTTKQIMNWDLFYFVGFWEGRFLSVCFSKVALYYCILFHSSLQIWVEFAADGHHYFFTVIVIPSVPILLVFMMFAKNLFFQQ